MRDEATGMPRTHPLAALTAIGRALVENSVRSMAMAIGASGFGGILEMLGNAAGPGLQSFSGMFVSIATIGLTAGFILYYILPFLPFMFFFFAVATWIKTVFEAAVGAPLWALAHLRIDGDGFSGQAASQGYFILLEIMLRPIVILFGLIGGMAAFGAMVAALNEIFDFVVVNIVGNSGSSIDTPDGFEPIRLSSLDQFFFTLVYTILVYMIANACFKMIDTIPKAFMRWIGSSVSTFNDNVGDPTANLVNYVGIAGNTIAPRILGGITQGSSTLGRAVGAVANTGNAAAKSGDGA